MKQTEVLKVSAERVSDDLGDGIWVNLIDGDKYYAIQVFKDGDVIVTEMKDGVSSKVSESKIQSVQSYKEELRGEIGGLIKFNDCSMPSSEDERIHKAEIAAYNQAISQVKSLLDKPQEE